MNPPKVNEYDYINFLIATQKAYSGMEAERVQPSSANSPAHDAITRLLHRLEPSPAALWSEAQQMVSLRTGILVVDDATLDKLCAKKMELVTRHLITGQPMTSTLVSYNDYSGVSLPGVSLPGQLKSIIVDLSNVVE